MIANEPVALIAKSKKGEEIIVVDSNMMLIKDSDGEPAKLTSILGQGNQDCQDDGSHGTAKYGSDQEDA